MNSKIFIPRGGNASEIIAEVGAEIARQTEESILGQLNDFVSRGLLTVERGQPYLVQAQDSAKIELRHTVQLKLKDDIYISSLERQLTELRSLVDVLRGSKASPPDGS